MRQFWNITSGIYAKCHIQSILLFVYTTTHNTFVIFTCRYFKLSWNTAALSQSNCRNFSCNSISVIVCLVFSLEILLHFVTKYITLLCKWWDVQLFNTENSIEVNNILFLIVLFRLTTGHTAGRSGQNTDIKKWFSKGKVMWEVEHGETLLLRPSKDLK